ncbi:MAG TPA: polysaccharide deacetylase family protein [Hyphomicrobiaceae bacterium]|jgi:peptidoglycan/xylan/chitin deacetylase (PgdA/CDA1 family)|nr:polysaccharide deacetylase family protein [Hyphomicrobiaceae bacterium]
MRRALLIAAMLLGICFAGAPDRARAADACPGNPNALGVERTVEIDTTGGPGFGTEQYKRYDFLRLKEVVLTFDDGPWPGNTRMVLEALAHHCTKATFFPIGKHALWHPEILKEVAAAGHTIGSHTWSHANLGRAKGGKATEEIEKGLSAVKLALGTAPAPFFRFPYLQAPQAQLDYLASRNIAIFSHDLDSFDFKIHKPEAVIKSVMGKLEKKGKGIILMHDFQHGTALALPKLLDDLKAGGYKIVHMRPKAPATTLAEWDEVARGEIKGGVSGNDKPMASVVRTIEEQPSATPAAQVKK